MRTLGQRIPIHRVYTRGCISIGGRCFSCLQAPPATLHPFLTWSTVTLSRRAKDYVYSAEVPPPPSCPLSLSLAPTSSSFALPFYFVPSFSCIHIHMYTHIRINGNSHTCSSDDANSKSCAQRWPTMLV